MPERLSLHAHARRLLSSTSPDGRQRPLLTDGHPLPDEPFPRVREFDGERGERLLAVLGPFLTDAAEAAGAAGAADAGDAGGAALLVEGVERRLLESFGGLGVGHGQVFAAVDSLPALDPALARALGLRLVREGADRRVVWTGLALLRGTAGPDEVPSVVTVGLLERCTEPAATVLASLDGTTGELVRLAERASRALTRRTIVRLLCERGDAAARDWLRRRGLGGGVLVTAKSALAVAEAADLPSAPLTDPEVLVHTGRLLTAMAAPEDNVPQIVRYAAARPMLTAFAAHAASLDPTLDHAVLLTSLVLDMHSGHARVLDWAPGERELAVDRLCEVLWGWPEHETSPWSEAGDLARVERAQAEWVARMRTRAPQREEDGARPHVAVHEGLPEFRIEVTPRDPAAWPRAETRILADGRPVIGAAHGSAPVRAPEVLLETGALRAGPEGEEPREVRLVEALCAEECCGALYAAIGREAGTVVWRVRRSVPGDVPFVLRFDAAQYDAEVDRAECDRGWEWPARTLVRLIRERLRAEPELLGRWGCVLDDVELEPGEHDLVRLTFRYPYGPGAGTAESPEDRPEESAGDGGSEAPWLRFMCAHRDNGKSPEWQAELCVGRLSRVDPTTYARIVGGTRAHARALGFRWTARPDRL